MQQILLSLLINPSDGTPGNFMVASGSNGIVGIDNDMAWGPEVVFVPRVNRRSLLKLKMFCIAYP